MSVRRLLITTNVDPAKAASGDVGYLVWFSPGRAGAFREFSVSMHDFWQLGNVVYDAEHTDFSYSGAYGSNTATLADVLNDATGKYLKQFDFNFSGNPSGYAGIFFGPATSSSLGTTGLNFDFYSDTAGVIEFTAKDNSLVSHICTQTVAEGWQSISIPWIGAVGVGFSQTTFAHPVSSFNIDTTSAKPTGTFIMNNMRYDSVVTMLDLAPTVVNGIQFAIEPVDAGTDDYLFYMNHLKVNKVIIDGTTAEPNKYKGIPRWTYKWNIVDAEAAYGAWRGPSAVGYNWLAGWTESGITNPDNGLVMSTAMLQMMYDSQQAYKTQFPAKQIGPFVPRYGRASWEALNTGGYVAGVWTDSTYNKWYWPDTDDWYGYTMRALLSVAQHYYLTESAQAKTILDNWMAWLDVYIIADGAYWQPPSGYGNDGVPTYTYKPVYAYACIAQACVYKYWIDGDALALKWYRRMLDTIYATKRLTGTGNCIGVSRGAEGYGYGTNASIVFSVNSGATAPSATAVMAGGKFMRADVTSQGVGISSITASISGYTTWD